MKVMCRICEKVFSTQFNLNKHLKNVHKTEPVAVSYDKSVWSYKCEEPNCNSSFYRSQGLIDHLRVFHKVEIESETLQFETLQDFHAWKEDVEKETYSNYVLLSGKRTSAAGGQTFYYSCNRTGKVPSSKYRDEIKESNIAKRLSKSQGSCKMNKSCISSIKLVKNDEKELFIAIWQKNHYGHTIEIQHLRLSQTDRNACASKLAAGVPKVRILKEIRYNIGNGLKRVDLVTKQDLQNVKRSFNIDLQEGVRSKDDAMSVHLCIEELQKCQFNPILLYKKHGESLEGFPFDEGDFCLIIMNQYQLHMLQKYGNNIIAIDGTHGLNNYDFELTTLMIVDNFNEGFPTAFMFTNRKDTLVHQIYFETIKSKIGNKISPKTFMSDITGVFYNAWSSVMGEVPHQLFCTWHIDRAWRNNLNKINNLEKRKEVFKSLKVLHQNVDETSFQKQLDQLLILLYEDVDTVEFGNYFNRHYYENCKLWAYCYRKHCGINTNMYLESMHKQIKYFYLGGMTVKRLDKGLHAVLQYSRDKMVERLIKETKGKSTIHKRNILQRHTKAVTSQFSVESIEKSENDECIKKWKLENVDTYFLEQKSYICCELTCDLCAICIHSYTCTCMDYYIKSMICKHIHFVALQNLPKQPSTSVSVSAGPGQSAPISEEIGTNIACLADQNNKALLSKNKLNQKIVEKISTISTILNENVDRIDYMGVGSEILSHLKIVENLLTIKKSDSDLILPFKTKKEITKRKIETQLRPFPVKKNKKQRKRLIEKPNKQESIDLSCFLHGDKLIAVSCDRTNDHSYISND